ncbi:GNAT family N-acetyltransferase [Pseudomonas sp. 5P_3.1_Bac2]|uniref:GNAT family N-acetyltransferase n=1 Tax=Pseudomonas sp. 5P_3.1_Bac2 TaxID=2971617 RepID=UPI0021C9F019|nr:GNAT family N-acetyltransferase [Pseudomonas sp. 5P_3.1_Bac2]MCU1717480.1 GNAT family N-acetyltransferase [Pseudomonas sp. 5P_3.1_Bac2]
MSRVFRRAGVADIESLFEIRTSVTENHLSRAQLTDLGITHSSLAQALEHSHCAWLVEDYALAVGFTMVDYETGELFALFVRPEFAGQGIGARLLAEAENNLFKQHTKIHLITDGNPHIRANGFYLRHGWYLAAAVDLRDVRYEKRRPGG